MQPQPAMLLHFCADLPYICCSRRTPVENFHGMRRSLLCLYLRPKELRADLVTPIAFTLNSPQRTDQMLGFKMTTDGRTFS